VGCRRESEEQKREKSVGQGKDSIISEEKRQEEPQSDAKAFILHLSQAG